MHLFTVFHIPASTYRKSLTRHMSAKFNEVKKLSYNLDDKASMAGIRTFDRKSRQSSLQLLTGGKEDPQMTDRPYKFIVDKDSDELDLRKISIFYFATSDGWNNDCGGGINVRSVEDSCLDIEAKKDRLVVLSSESCEHKMNEWNGNDEMQSASYIITHLVKDMS